MPIDAINDIMTYGHNWLESGLGESGESYLVGPDKKSRTISRFLIEDKSAYLNILRALGVEDKIVKDIEAKNTNIGLQSISTSGVKKALSGETGFDIFPDYRNIEVLSAYSPINIQGLQWVILTEIDEAEAFGAAHQIADDIFNISTWVILVLLSLGLVVGVLFAKNITKPIIGLSLLLQDIEKNSDLTLRSDIKSKDEIGSAANSLNQMLDKFHQSIKDVGNFTDQIASATEQTSVISGETKENISEQQVATEQVATATQQLSSTVQVMTNNITRTAEAAHKAFDETVVGDKVLTNTISDIANFADEIAEATDSIHKLEIATNNISQVVEVIKSIAEQTNLLALNAALDAARDGEHGRGFAVVADEVRTLAGRTQDSTEEINQMVEQLQSSASSSVQLMSKQKEQIHKVVEHAQEAGQSLNNISKSVNEINHMSTQVATAAEQQVCVTGEISQSLLQITGIADRTAEGSQQTFVASDELAKLAVRMSELVAQFKVG
jgi:methyl-accepting chemotaxis protein